MDDIEIKKSGTNDPDPLFIAPIAPYYTLHIVSLHRLTCNICNWISCSAENIAFEGNLRLNPWGCKSNVVEINQYSSTYYTKLQKLFHR